MKKIYLYTLSLLISLQIYGYNKGVDPVPVLTDALFDESKVVMVISKPDSIGENLPRKDPSSPLIYKNDDRAVFAPFIRKGLTFGFVDYAFCEKVHWIVFPFSERRATMPDPPFSFGFVRGVTALVVAEKMQNEDGSLREKYKNAKYRNKLPYSDLEGLETIEPNMLYEIPSPNYDKHFYIKWPFGNNPHRQLMPEEFIDDLKELELIICGKVQEVNLQKLYRLSGNMRTELGKRMVLEVIGRYESIIREGGVSGI